MLCFYAIAAMSENRVIGNHGKIPWHLPDDFRWFKHKTLGQTILMGRKTYQSIGRPLPGRKTIVLTRSPEPISGVEICRDENLLIQRWKEDCTFNQPLEGLTICGGAEVYREFLPYCSALYLTRVKQSVDGDTFFPPFEETYKQNQIIHETEEFRIERWHNNSQAWRFLYEPPPEEWPFKKP